MLRSYLLEKPWRVIRGVFYWNTPFSVTMQQLQAVQYVDLALCGIAVLCALLRRRLRGNQAARIKKTPQTAPDKDPMDSDGPVPPNGAK